MSSLGSLGILLNLSHILGPLKTQESDKLKDVNLSIFKKSYSLVQSDSNSRAWACLYWNIHFYCLIELGFTAPLVSGFTAKFSVVGGREVFDDWRVESLRLTFSRIHDIVGLSYDWWSWI